MDEEVRALEAAAIKGDEISARRLVEARRRNGFDSALQGWVERLRGALSEHLRESAPILYEDAAYRERELAIRLEAGPKFVRVMKGSSAYAFIEKATGNILKPASWRSPEPKKIPRGSIYGANPLAGCGPYGVAYVNGHGNFPWGKAAQNAAPIVQAPAPPPEVHRETITAPDVTVRVKETFAPCTVLGQALEDTGTHFKYKDKDTGRVKLAKKSVQPKYSMAMPRDAHIVPCDRCQDHPDSRFKPGNCGIHGRPEPCESCQSM